MKRIYKHDYQGNGGDPSPLGLADLAPPWRSLSSPVEPRETPQTPQPRTMSSRQANRGEVYLAEEREALMVTAALALRRPLLITGPAGVGKTSLAYSVAWQLGLGDVLRWNITSRTTLKEALYEYDAVSRLHDVALKDTAKRDPADIGSYLKLGPLGTALKETTASPYFPRVLLIDELDKADADLPSDLLHVLEEGSFSIDELSRHADENQPDEVEIRTVEGNKVSLPRDGMVRARDFPFIIMTSNGERDFSPAFRRRCLPLEILPPTEEKLAKLVSRHLGDAQETLGDAIKEFGLSERKLVATDQILNALFLLRSSQDGESAEWENIKRSVLRPLDEAPHFEPGS